MKDRLQGAAAGGGVGLVGMTIQAVQQYAEQAQSAKIAAASQEAMVALLNVTARMCGGG